MPENVPQPTEPPFKATMDSLLGARGRERQFLDVFHRSSLPMVLVDNDRRYVDANRAARLVLRLSLTELQRRRIDHLTPPHMSETLRDRWEALQDEGQVSGQYDVQLPDRSRLRIVYCALANVLPGQHLIVFMPADWPADELAFADAHEAQPEPAPIALSVREREVLTLIATGADFEQIGEDLTIAITTVKTHAQNALRKLGARNRAHAVALAMHHALIELPPRQRRS